MTRLRADALLLLAALIWGATFVAQKQANSAMGPLLFVGLRFWLGALVVAPFAWREARRAPRPFDGREWASTIVMGLCLFSGSVLQQIGLQTASATDGGFLTAVYVIMVPYLVWALSGAAPRPRVLVAGLVSVMGAWLLAGGAVAQVITFLVDHGSDRTLVDIDVVFAVLLLIAHEVMTKGTLARAGAAAIRAQASRG